MDNKIEFMTKHCMFGLKVYPSPENFTMLDAMVVTFCMSEKGSCSNANLCQKIMFFFYICYVYT